MLGISKNKTFIQKKTLGSSFFVIKYSPKILFDENRFAIAYTLP